MKQLCDHLGLGTIPIVGWSDGGNTGLHFALHYPQRLERLVLISANYHFQGIDMNDIHGGCRGVVAILDPSALVAPMAG